MAKQERNRLTLNTVGFQPTVFNPTEYKPVDFDYSILERSLAKQEARQASAIEKSSALDIDLGKIKQNLHNDDETNRWFENYKNNIQREINSAIEVGDYAGAINLATQMAGEINSDNAVIGRIKANAEYQKKVDEVHARRINGDIDEDTENWWLANNKYNYEDKVDDNGNIIGGTSYIDLKTPVNSINIADFAKKAFDYISPKVTAYSVTNKDGTGSSYNMHEVTRKQLLDNIDDLLDKYPGARASFEQQYKVKKYKYEDLKRKYKEDPEKYGTQFEIIQKEMERNGSVIPEKEFYVNTIEQSAIVNNMPYKNTSTSSDNYTGKGTGTGTDTGTDTGTGTGTGNGNEVSTKGNPYQGVGGKKGNSALNFGKLAVNGYGE